MNSGTMSGSTLGNGIDYDALSNPSDLQRRFNGPTTNVHNIPSRKKLSERQIVKARLAAMSAASHIDKYFRERIKITERGKTFRVSRFEAIVMVLHAKACAGDQLALTALIRYSKFGYEEAQTEKRVVVVYERDDGIYIQENWD